MHDCTPAAIDTVTVAIRRLPGAEDIPLPAYQSPHAAGMDLHAAVTDPITLAPGIPGHPGTPGTAPAAHPGPSIALIPCGFAMAVPPGYEAQIRPRSGLAVKHGISMPNTPGTIDADYRGEIKVPLINLGPEPFTVTRGMRIAQLIVKPVPRTQWLEVAELPPTSRGDGGFGHTGH